MAPPDAAVVAAADDAAAPADPPSFAQPATAQRPRPSIAPLNIPRRSRVPGVRVRRNHRVTGSTSAAFRSTSVAVGASVGLSDQRAVALAAAALVA